MHLQTQVEHQGNRGGQWYHVMLIYLEVWLVVQSILKAEVEIDNSAVECNSGPKHGLHHATVASDVAGGRSIR